ncbi:VOC family protein [Rhizobium ruizarguesonis]|jgi:predicted enzyme related to lactoylglutathione lyase|nr:VOC family protein [Rhizobium ruizarguesonis]TBY71338.1 VOC family protein [Rhizobium leguminosarum bv. viciae]TBB27453.1 VOC family protein [Rhizobium ruizarguesonis]TBB44333.1 VOC family protein [Rhizobium ruizarguesonis]TBC78183.1 VOC family protein [Rhizobium ruizarguesonis]
MPGQSVGAEMFAVRYFVKDVSASIKYYSDAFDFELAQQYGPAMAILTKDNLTLWLAGPASSAVQAEKKVNPDIMPGFNRIVVLTDDIKNVTARALDCGGRVRIDIGSGPTGEQSILEDPDGNLIELFSSRP